MIFKFNNSTKYMVIDFTTKIVHICNDPQHAYFCLCNTPEWSYKSCDLALSLNVDNANLPNFEADFKGTHYFITYLGKFTSIEELCDYPLVDHTL